MSNLHHCEFILAPACISSSEAVVCRLASWPIKLHLNDPRAGIECVFCQQYTWGALCLISHIHERSPLCCCWLPQMAIQLRLGSTFPHFWRQGILQEGLWAWTDVELHPQGWAHVCSAPPPAVWKEAQLRSASHKQALLHVHVGPSPNYPCATVNLLAWSAGSVSAGITAGYRNSSTPCTWQGPLY